MGVRGRKSAGTMPSTQVAHDNQNEWPKARAIWSSCVVVAGVPPFWMAAPARAPTRWFIWVSSTTAKTATPREPPTCRKMLVAGVAVGTSACVRLRYDAATTGIMPNPRPIPRTNRETPRGT